MSRLHESDAPWWGAVEWLLQGNKTQAEWFDAFDKVLNRKDVYGKPTRLVTIYNWDGIKDRTEAIAAIRQMNNNFE